MLWMRATPYYISHEESIENNGNIMYIASTLFTCSIIDIKCLCARKGEKEVLPIRLRKSAVPSIKSRKYRFKFKNPRKDKFSK